MEGQVQPQNPIEAVAAVLERDEPEFQKAQERANHPQLDEPESKEKPEEKKPEEKAEEKPEEKAEGKPEESAEEDEITLDLEAPLFETKFKGDGGEDKVEKLSIKQLQSGYMMQRDYQRKTAELAKQREALQKEVESKTKPVLEQYEKELNIYRQAVMAAIAPELQGVNLMELASSDPAAYIQKQARLQQVGQVIQQIDSKLKQVEQAKAQEASQAKAKQIQESIEILQREIPGWGNEKYQELMKYGVDFGYTPQEMAETIDARMFKLLDAAKKYDSLQKAKPEVEKKVVKLPKVVKPGTADRNEKADRKEERWSRLNKERTPEAAAAVIYDML